MADVHHVISLGIGTPADIPHFILVGLSPAAGGPVTEATADWVIHCAADVSTILCRADGTPQVRDDVTTIRVRPDVDTIHLPADDDTIEVP